VQAAVSPSGANPQSSRWLHRVPIRASSVILSIAVLAIGFFSFSQRIQWHEIARIWSHFDVGWLLAALALYWIQYPINSLRQFLIVHWLTGVFSDALSTFLIVLRLTCAQGFVAAAAPFGMIGDVAKIVGFKMLSGLSLTEATRFAFFDRLLGMQWLGIFGLATFPIQMTTGVAPMIMLSQLVVSFGIAVGIMAVLVMPHLLGLLRYKFFASIAPLFVGYRSILIPARLGIQMVIAALNLALAGGSLYALTVAAGLSINPWLVVAFISLLQFINSLPFLYLGWGGREIALVATLGSAGGLSVNEALSISAAWGVILMVAGAVSGVLLIGSWEPRTIDADRNRCGGAE
jgi:uncharacterized membrane protein YbhN (UPF0104 family)